MVLVCLTHISGCVAFLPYPRITHHLDSFVVMETPTRDYAVGIRGMFRASLEFYRHYEDAFDVLVFLSQSQYGFVDRWGAGVQGRMVVARNTEQGTGTGRKAFGWALGSDARLRGVVQLANTDQILTGSLLHELVHLWYSNLEVIPTEYLGHWGFSSVGGRLGGFQRDELKSLGDGKYSAGFFRPHDAGKSVPYSELEMYLAGWIPASDVPDIWVAEDGAWSKKDLTEEEMSDCEIEEGPLAGTLSLDCISELDADGNRVFTANEISIWTIEQIIEKLGPRIPNFENSQKEFRIAFILLTDGRDPVTKKDLDITKVFIEQFTATSPLPHPIDVRIDESTRLTATFHDPSGKELKPLNFWEATRGIAILQADELQSFRR